MLNLIDGLRTAGLAAEKNRVLVVIVPESHNHVSVLDSPAREPGFSTSQALTGRSRAAGIIHKRTSLARAFSGCHMFECSLPTYLVLCTGMCGVFEVYRRVVLLAAYLAARKRPNIVDGALLADDARIAQYRSGKGWPES